jgi:hypothetical protein
MKSWSLLLAALVLMTGCDDPIQPEQRAPAALPVPTAASGAPSEVPFFEEFQDINPCTGQVVTYTFTGSARIRESADHFILVAKGSVVTSDGFSGSFNRQFVFIGDRVTHLRFHDMEVNSATGQRIIFGVGLFHETSPQGQPVVSFEHFSGLRCVGKRAA